MTTWAPMQFLEAALKNTDSRLMDSPENIDLRFERAIILNELGRSEDAKNAYIAILKQTPTHFGALNNFGALLMSMGMPAAAIIAYNEAVKHHPDNPKGHVNLADTLFKKGDFDTALNHFKTALQLDPEYKAAHQGLSYIYTELGDQEKAAVHRQKGFGNNHTITLPYRGTGTPVVLLLLASSIGGMIPFRHHLDDKIFYTSVVFVESYNPKTPLPPHQLVFNAIGDADLCKPDFDNALALLKQTTAPVLNHPSAVCITGRAENAARLTGIPGLVTPRIITLSKEELGDPDVSSLLARHGFSWPVLLRSPGFHTGRNFLRVENTQQLAAALPNLPGKELMVIQHLDARSIDGKIRKYRVMMIDGKLYPMHAAISHDWKVHYFSADMADKPEHREEDKQFLENMEAVLGTRAIKTLEAICDKLGLDYAGIDFSVDRNGNMLLFEANATMVVNPPDKDEKWAYRTAPVQRILDAIREMLVSRVKMAQAASSLPPTVDLLTMGGDKRIERDPIRGVNKYGCPPVPEPKVLAYGSATASTVSSEGFFASEQLRNKLQQAAGAEPPHITYARELGRMRGTLHNLLKLTKGTEIVFSASGTDLHLLTPQLLRNEANLLVVLLEEEETGSGVPEALKGRNIQSTGNAIEMAFIQKRAGDGTARPDSTVDAEVETRVQKGIAAGQHVLLVLTDVSKTGMISPSPAIVSSLHKQFPEKTTVLVDACQFRLAPSTLHAYLEHGFLVAITGSKFVTGPAFSGALIIPERQAVRLRHYTLSAELSAYSLRADWPEGWAARNMLDDRANFGLLLRWEAALTELQAFHALPEASVAGFINAFATAIRKRMAEENVFEPLSLPEMNRYPVVNANAWDTISTIFPFLLHRNKKYLGRDAMQHVYQQLRSQGYQLGQPVLCGTRDGIEVSALRLCNSIRLIVDALSPKGRGKNAVIMEVLLVLDKVAMIVKEMT